MTQMWAALVAVAGLWTLVTAHKIELGRCKSLPEVRNFDPDKFAGVWYVVESMLASSSCMVLVFNRTENGFTVQDSRELLIAKTIGLDHVWRSTGTVAVSSNHSAKMTMDMPWTPRFLTTYLTVVDTDYTQFAVLYECTTMLLVRRYTVRILGRQPTLDDALIDQWKAKLKEMEINPSSFNKINHNNCNRKGQADFDINVSDSTIGFSESNNGTFGDSELDYSAFGGSGAENITSDVTEANNELDNEI
ncbi:apolipoprotein D [Procambarus clarkii]|uniref:apolipoprotein D n=1 Tax=Procambarus clarkii TaxID=6728 RepID=UPI003741F572